jgi:hypothetical protein
MEQIDRLVHAVEHNYLLIGAAAVLFFGAKAVTGYFTYRKFMKELKDIKALLQHK